MDKTDDIEEKVEGQEKEKAETVTSAQGGKPARSGPRTMKHALLMMGLAWLVGVVLQNILGGSMVSRKATVVVGLVAFLGVMFAGLSRPWRRFLSSVQFAAPALFVLTGFSVLGTLILQNVSDAQLVRGYGEGMTRLIKGLFLDDLFHSLGFAAVMGMGAGALALVAVRKRRYNVRNTGSVLAHGGLVLILAGACIGMVWGIKGRIDLHEGQTADSMVVRTRDGKIARVPLGFELRLDDFTIERYEPDYSVMVYAIEGNKQKRLLSFKPGRDSREKLARYGLELVGWWPNYTRRTVVEPAGKDAKGVVSAVKLKAKGKEWWLFDDEATAPRPVEIAGHRLALVWQEQRARSYIEGLAKTGESEHVLVVDGKPVPVSIGREIPLPGGGKVRIERFFNDFVIDSQTRKPSNRSAEPNNPAIEVVVLGADGKRKGRRFLFAKFPDFHGSGKEGVKLAYRYGKEAAARPEAVLVGENRKLLLSGKQGLDEIEIGQDGRFSLGKDEFVVAQWLERAVRKEVEQSAGSREENPVARLRARSAGTFDVVPGKPVRYSRDRFVVLAPTKGEMVRDYLSTVTVLKDGKPVLEKRLIEVNSPLNYGGFGIYQANYREEDPTYSGFEVVRDPGLPVVYLGLLANLIGVAMAVWGPRLQRRLGRKEGRK